MLTNYLALATVAMFFPKALLAAVAVARLASAQVVNPDDVDKATRRQ